MSELHPFAQYIAILGQGRHGTRSLTRLEAKEAMRMILNDEVEDVQLGAFMTLLRVKEETAEELAGFLEAAQESLSLSAPTLQVDLNWSSYAGKKRQLPWYILATLLLAENNIKVLMHGITGEDSGRIYAKSVLAELGLPIATTIDEAAAQVKENNFAYIDLEIVSPKLYNLMNLRPLLGLRLPSHTVARMLNPFNAPHSMQGIFHRGYQNLHQGAAIMLEQPHMAVIKGEGGEAERIPNKPCLIECVHNGEMTEEEWPEIISKKQPQLDTMDLSPLLSVWQGASEDEYGEAAVTGTVAITLYMMGLANSREDAESKAQAMWLKRKSAKKDVTVVAA